MESSPHQAILAELVKPTWRQAIANTDELQRIIRIPREEWSDVDAEELALQMTELLRIDGGTMQLRPFQSVALYTLAKYGCLVCMGRVGVGKTLISFLSPYIVEAMRPLLVIPANLRRKTERDVYQYKEHFEVSSMMAVESYQKLARKSFAYYFEVTKPDLLVFDESHYLKNTKAAITRRVKRYLETCYADKVTCSKTGAPRTYPDPKLVLLSGTFTNRSLADYWHLLKWALPREMIPMPLELSEFQMWCNALDEGVQMGQRVRPGALSLMYNEEEKQLEKEGKELVAARRTYSRRLVQTPGIVATKETFMGATISVRELHQDIPPLIETAFEQLRHEWELPDGEELADGLMVSKAAKELSLGFFYVWDPKPPKEWMDARKAWFKSVRRTLSYNQRGLDTEEQVKDAVLEGLYPKLIESLFEWLKVKDTYKQNVTPIWIDDFAIDAAISWMKKNKGIVWVSHTAFGNRLSDLTGVPYYGEGGFDRKKSFIEEHPPGAPLIASTKANKEGKNLQAWNTNLVINPPQSCLWWEQLMGRTHRDGQLSKHITFDVFGSCMEHYTSFWKAVDRAIYVQDSSLQVQKLLYADIEIPSLDDLPYKGVSWMTTGKPPRLQEDEEHENSFRVSFG